MIALARVLDVVGRAREAARVAREAVDLFERKGATALAEHARGALAWG